MYATPTGGLRLPEPPASAAARLAAATAGSVSP